MSALSGLKPASLWKYFEDICQIPHCSKEEKEIAAFLMSLAEKTGHTARQDKVGNIVIEVPASPGKENSPVVVLQGHMDMVCEKNSDTKHDFSKDPVKPVINGDWVTADGTTLGADNGIGMATALSFLEDKETVHGPLELLFTVDEETGLNGAMALEPDFLKGRILLNLDSEEEGIFSIGCAGGADTDISLPLTRKGVLSGKTLQLKLYGYKGGHSGIDIDKGRANTVQLLARILYDLKTKFQLITIEGGSKHNAIPREAFATVAVEPGSVDAFKAEADKLFQEIKFEYKAVETDAALGISDISSSDLPLDEDDARNYLAFLVALPHGITAMNMEIKGLVETSTNLAIVRTKKDEANVYLSTRSSIISALESVRSKIEACARLAGASVKQLEGYPAWTPNLQSPLLKTTKDVYKRVSGKEAEVIAIHAGLECGIIGEKYDGMDMISIGPDLQSPHSPDERVGISSVERFYELVKELLKELS